LSFVYFTDRDLGKRFPEILKTGGLTVERHADHFAHDTPDEVWLEAVGKRGWIALTMIAASAISRTSATQSYATASLCW
jgi:hypothetical protein